LWCYTAAINRAAAGLKNTRHGQPLERCSTIRRTDHAADRRYTRRAVRPALQASLSERSASRSNNAPPSEEIRPPLRSAMTNCLPNAEKRMELDAET